jgi:hypothetical protein
MKLSLVWMGSFAIQNTDWAYNGKYTITVTSGSTANLRVSLIGGEGFRPLFALNGSSLVVIASSSTHGNTMGTRTLFPDVSWPRPSPHDHSSTEFRRLSAWMAHVVRTRWPDTLTLVMGPDRRRSRKARQLATWSGVHDTRRLSLFG